MIILHQVIHYTNTNSVEATWVDEDGNQVRCHSYADVQMDMLRADLGADAAAYSALIATVEAGIVPVTPKALEVPERIEALQGLLVLDSAGLGPAYEAWALSPDRTFAQKAFINKATHWKRTDPTLLAATTTLGLTSAQVDAFFIDGATR